MLKDRKVKKAIDKALRPRKPFEQFCKEHDIDIESKPKPARKNKLVYAFSTMAAACVLVLALTLPFVLKSPIVPDEKYYSDNDVYNGRIEYEEFLEESVFMPINFENVEQHGNIFKVTANDVDDLKLGYIFENILFGFWTDDNLFAYEVGLVVRCYKGYLFSSERLFDNLDSAVNVEDTEYGFRVGESAAYIKFEVQNREYFITLKGMEDITETNKDTVELFINHLLRTERT